MPPYPTKTLISPHYRTDDMLSDKSIGILGGGQLGAMLIRHAIDFGLRIAVLDADTQASTAGFTASFTKGSPLNYDDVLRFGKNCDILTIEMEAVNTKALEELMAMGKEVYPAPQLIATIQNKYHQKKLLQSLQLPVSPGILIARKEDLYQHIDKLPACLKLCTGGYDGKGVMMLQHKEDIDNAFDAPSVLEELVAIEAELSVIVARNKNGQVQCYDPVLMVFDKVRNLIDYQLCPAPFDEALLTEAKNIAENIANSVDLVGILAVELFITKDNKLLVNELAPRPHNSGHHSIEACVTSQYEQMLRAILNLPLGDTSTTGHSLMMNIIEPDAHGISQTALAKLLAVEGAHLHWYGKAGGRPGRKMGHITIVGGSEDEVKGKANEIRKILN